MCGRYAATKNQADLVEEFEVEVDATGEPTRAVMTHQQNPPAGQRTTTWPPPRRRRSSCPARYVAPTTMLRRSARLRLVNWGLVQRAKDVKIGNRMINSRADSVLEKPAFKRAAKSRRCLVPAEERYEWRSRRPRWTPRASRASSPSTRTAPTARMAFAGLYEFWRDKAVEDPDDPDAWLTSFTIITTDAEPGLDRIHDRQPLVLERSDWAAWLDPQTDEETVRRLLAFEQPGRFDAYPISTEVNNTRNNGPELLLPLAADEYTASSTS